MVCFFIIIVVLLQSGKSGDILRLLADGQPNGFRSSRGGERAFEGDDLVSGCVYDHFDHPIGLLQQAQRSILGLAGSEVRTGEDATRAASGNALYSAKITAIAVGDTVVLPFRSFTNQRDH